MKALIKVANSARYNSYYNSKTHIVEFVITSLIDKVTDFYVGLPLAHIVIRPIKAKRGFFFHGQSVGNRTIEIDCRQSDVWVIADTLAHEFCHMQQKVTGMLVPTYNSKSEVRWTDYMGNASTHSDRVKTYEEYLALPWEVDARNKAAEFVQRHTLYINDLERRAPKRKNIYV